MRPNPWVLGPALAMGVAGGIIGRLVARASCVSGRDPALGEAAGCPALEWVSAVVVGIGVFVGGLVVAVLVVRSFDEWRRQNMDGTTPPDVAGGEGGDQAADQ